MRVALLTFDGFDEVGTFVALGLLQRAGADGWKAELACPSAQVTSMSGVTVHAQQPLEYANEADAVIFGASLYSRAIAENSALLDRLQPDPVRQLFAGHGGGNLLLARLGLLADLPACSDEATRPWLVEAGVRVSAEPFGARGCVATAGGPLAAQSLAAWLLWRGAGVDVASRALAEIAPVGDRAHAERVLATVRPFVAGA